MHALPFSALLLMMTSQALAGDCLVRVGYPDRERRPYFMGNGSAPADPPGIGVELLSKAAVSAGCKVVLVRLPTPRLRVALTEGAIDLTFYDFIEGDVPFAVLPRTGGGAPDTKRALRALGVVYVRRADAAAVGEDPRGYFQRHRLAVNQGTPLAMQLRGVGVQVDDGAGDAISNFEKVMLKRADGVVLTTLSETAMDGFMASRYGGALVRIDTPIKISYVWFATSKAFHQAHRQPAEDIWKWVGTQAPAHVDGLLRKYEPH